jgi:hypothetical protein
MPRHHALQDHSSNVHNKTLRALFGPFQSRSIFFFSAQRLLAAPPRPLPPEVLEDGRADISYPLCVPGKI